MFKRLEKYFYKDDIEKFLSKYDEQWRYFHNRNHLQYIIEHINHNLYDETELDILYLTTLFHDIVYLPWSNTNEEDSADLFKEYKDLAHSIIESCIMEEVVDNILDTKTHSKDNIFNNLDMYIVYKETDINKIIEWEDGIFKEYSFVPYNIYKEKRIELLNNWSLKNDKLLFLIDYFKC